MYLLTICRRSARFPTQKTTEKFEKAAIQTLDYPKRKALKDEEVRLHQLKIPGHGGHLIGDNAGADHMRAWPSSLSLTH